MKKKIADLWVKALRSGEYKQTNGTLCNKGDSFCCLGVLEELHVQERQGRGELYYGWKASQFGRYTINGFDDLLSNETMEWSGIKTDDGKLPSLDESLIFLNDEDGKTFPEIADIIEKHWKEL